MVLMGVVFCFGGLYDALGEFCGVCNYINHVDGLWHFM